MLIASLQLDPLLCRLGLRRRGRREEVRLEVGEEGLRMSHQEIAVWIDCQARCHNTASFRRLIRLLKP